jgi:biotin carboxyl carrier protein
VSESRPERRKTRRRASDVVAPATVADPRSDGDRAADHAAIDRLASDVLPALMAKLGATGLGEIEVREGPWKVRLRRPAPGPNYGRRASDRPSRTQPGHAGHGHAPGAFEGHRPARGATGGGGSHDHSTNGSGPVGTPVRAADTPEPGHPERRRGDPDPHRAVATAPAVGIFRPRGESKVGTRVREGDRLAAVDVLGVPQEVLAPADGVVGATLVEGGEAVEYGQELIVIERITSPVAGGGDRAREPA